MSSQYETDDAPLNVGRIRKPTQEELVRLLTIAHENGLDPIDFIESRRFRVPVEVLMIREEEKKAAKAAKAKAAKAAKAKVTINTPAAKEAESTEAESTEEAKALKKPTPQEVETYLKIILMTTSLTSFTPARMQKLFAQYGFDYRPPYTITRGVDISDPATAYAMYGQSEGKAEKGKAKGKAEKGKAKAVKPSTKTNPLPKMSIPTEARTMRAFIVSKGLCKEMMRFAAINGYYWPWGDRLQAKNPNQSKSKNGEISHKSKKYNPHKVLSPEDRANDWTLDLLGELGLDADDLF